MAKVKTEVSLGWSDLIRTTQDSTVREQSSQKNSAAQTFSFDSEEAADIQRRPCAKVWWQLQEMTLQSPGSEPR